MNAREPEGSDSGLSWSAGFGAATGLMLGVVCAITLAAALHALKPGSRMAEILWEVTAPLLGLGGMLIFALGFRRFFGDRVGIPAACFLAALAIAIWIAFYAVGFPWREPGG